MTYLINLAICEINVKRASCFCFSLNCLLLNGTEFYDYNLCRILPCILLSFSVCVGVRNIKTNQLQNGQFIDFESHQEFYHFKDLRWRSLGLYKKNSPSHGDVSETKLVFTVIWQIYLILRSLWKLILFINHRFCRFIPSLFFFNKNGPITTHPDFTWPSCVRLDVAVWTIFLCVRFWRRYNEIT